MNLYGFNYLQFNGLEACARMPRLLSIHGQPVTSIKGMALGGALTSAKAPAVPLNKRILDRPFYSDLQQHLMGYFLAGSPSGRVSTKSIE